MLRQYPTGTEIGRGLQIPLGSINDSLLVFVQYPWSMWESGVCSLGLRRALQEESIARQ